MTGGRGGGGWQTERCSQLADSFDECAVNECASVRGPGTDAKQEADGGTGVDGEFKENSAGSFMISPAAAADGVSGGSSARHSDSAEAALSASKQNNIHSAAFKHADVGRILGDTSRDPQPSSPPARQRATEADSSVDAAAALAPSPAEPSHNQGAASQGKQKAKQTKKASAATSQLKSSGEERSDAGVAKPTDTSTNKRERATSAHGDVMTDILGKRQRQGEWQWQVRWKSGAVVSG